MTNQERINKLDAAVRLLFAVSSFAPLDRVDADRLHQARAKINAVGDDLAAEADQEDR